MSGESGDTERETFARRDNRKMTAPSPLGVETSHGEFSRAPTNTAAGWAVTAPTPVGHMVFEVVVRPAGFSARSARVPATACVKEESSCMALGDIDHRHLCWDQFKAVVRQELQCHLLNGTIWQNGTLLWSELSWVAQVLQMQRAGHSEILFELRVDAVMPGTPSSTASGKRKRYTVGPGFKARTEYDELYDVSDHSNDGDRKRSRDNEEVKPSTVRDSMMFDSLDLDDPQHDQRTAILQSTTSGSGLSSTSVLKSRSSHEDKSSVTGVDAQTPSGRATSIRKRAAAPATKEDPIEIDDSDSEDHSSASPESESHAYVDIGADGSSTNCLDSFSEQDEEDPDIDENEEEEVPGPVIGRRSISGYENTGNALTKPEDYDIEVGEVFNRQYKQLDAGASADSIGTVLQIVSDDRCRWDPETWDVMVRDYGLRANDYSNANTRTLQGLKAGRKPTIGQTYAATLLRQQAHTVGGGLLSDEPGLGKTQIIFLIHIYECKQETLYDQFQEIKQFKSLREFTESKYCHTHLAPTRIGGVQTLSSRCPSGIALQTSCACEEHGPTADLTPKRGFFMLIVPAKGVGNCLKEWRDCVNAVGGGLGLECLYAHSDKTYPNHNAQRLTRENAHKLRSNPVTGLPPRGQTRYLLIMSEKAFDRHVKRVIARNPPPAQSNAHCPIDFLPGSICRDEHHEIKGSGSDTVRHIMEMKQHAEAVVKGRRAFWTSKGSNITPAKLTGMQKSWMPYVWGISGTPWTVDFRSLEGIITCIEQPWWGATNNLKRCTVNSVTKIGKTTKSLARRSEKVDQMDDAERRHLAADVADNGREMKAVLDQLEIRRTSMSRNMAGEAMVQLPPHEVRRCFCDNTEEQQRALDDLETTLLKDMEQSYLKAKQAAEAKGQPVPPANWDNYFARAGKLKAATVIPELLPLAHEHHLQLTSAELKDQGWTKHPDGSIYATHLDRLTSNTPKLQLLANDIVRRLGTDVEGRPEKLIVYASASVVCLIVYLFLTKEFPRFGVKWMHTDCPTAERMTRFIEPFLENDSPRIIVGTKRVMGSCYTMTRAFRTVSLDVDWDPALDKQCDGRVCRYSQRNLKTYNFYILNRTGLDQKTLNKQDRDAVTRWYAH